MQAASTITGQASPDSPGRSSRHFNNGHAPVFAAALAYYSVAWLLLDDMGVQVSREIAWIFLALQQMLLPLIVVVPVYGFFYLVVTSNGERPFHRIARWLRRTPFLEIVLQRFLPMVLVLGLVQIAYAAFKRSIPEFVPYGWDPLFADMDRVLFLGSDPWILTHALLPWPAATWTVALAYALWIFLILGSYAAVSCMPLDSRNRMTYLLAFILCWSVGGSLLATVFSSAGPVYVERLFGDDAFTPLMRLLAEQNGTVAIYSLEVQESLWRGYADPSYPAMGISAFPSMHLCTSALVMILGFRIGRVLGWALAGFTALMLFGSVHLGWHYAVDGIAGIALAFGFWAAARRITDWWFDRAVLRMAGRSAGVL